MEKVSKGYDGGHISYAGFIDLARDFDIFPHIPLSNCLKLYGEGRRAFSQPASINVGAKLSSVRPHPPSIYIIDPPQTIHVDIAMCENPLDPQPRVLQSSTEDAKRWPRDKSLPTIDDKCHHGPCEGRKTDSSSTGLLP